MTAIRLNGAPADLPAEATLVAALARLGLDAGTRGVAVAVDGEVVPRSHWEGHRLGEGASVEILTASQGG